MKIGLDTEKDDWITLKHVRCILDRFIEKVSGEDMTIPTELKTPLAIISEIEDKIGKVVPLMDFEKELSKKNFKNNEIVKIIDKLKKHGLIFEVRQGFIQRI